MINESLSSKEGLIGSRRAGPPKLPANRQLSCLSGALREIGGRR